MSMGKALLRAKKQSEKGARERYQVVIDAQRDLIQTEERNHMPKKEVKLKSIWETTNMEQFLSIADDREQGYMAERNVRIVVGGNVHVVGPDNRVVPQTDDRDWFTLSSKLTIPKRPEWNYSMSADEVQNKEKADFVEWRRSLAKAEESSRVLMTPFEKNLDVWRQLWRVIEKSDFVLEILDARNPMAFRSVDLENYITTFKNAHGVQKQTVLLLNKADLLTENQRKVWADYLTSRGEKFFFFSAKPAEDATPAKVDEPEESKAEEVADEEEIDDEDADISKLMKNKKESSRHARKKLKGGPTKFANPYELEAQRKAMKEEKSQPPKPKPIKETTAEELARDERIRTRLSKIKPYDVVSPEDLLDLLAALRASYGFTDPNVHMMVGMVGYPNVGKSSTINAIIGCKKVVVSATPGKTKHFQTLPIPNERRIMLCDCPGLVFPSFAATRETMVCDGILPVDTVKDYVTPIGVVCERIPQIILETMFRVSLRRQDDLDDCTSYADRLLSAVARRRGYMTEHDKPNRHKAARDILKMYVDGVLVFVHPPRGYTQEIPPELVVAQSQPHPQPTSSAAAATAEAEVVEGEDDDEVWEDISDAGEARALSEDGEDYYDEEEEEEARRRDYARMPLFFERPKGPITNRELFNYETNVAIATNLIKAREAVKPRKKKANPQLEEDPTVFINEHGMKELLIDSDDDIEEYAPHAGSKQVVVKEKHISKKKMRRELKRTGGHLPQNPTKRTMGVAV